MIKFEHTEVVGWEAAIRGMRNPMNSWEKSDSGYMDPDKIVMLGQNDLDLMKRLRNAGTDHRKFMRMITVYVDITAPLYWVSELDTYKVGSVRNSCSFMHKGVSKPFTIDDFSIQNKKVYEALRPLQKNRYELIYPYETNEYKIYTDLNGRTYRVYKNGKVIQEAYEYIDNYGSGRTRVVAEREATIWQNSSGYFVINLSGRTGGKIQLHRLIAELWCDKPDGVLQVNHKDGNKGNNCSENLEWVTASDNMQHAVENGLYTNLSSLHRKYKSWKSGHNVIQTSDRMSFSVDCANGMSHKKLAKKYNITTTQANNLRSCIKNSENEELFQECYVWDRILQELNCLRKIYLETNDDKIFQAIRCLLPQGYLQKSTYMLNYEILTNIYNGRKNHRLDEWREGFIEWIESLPYSELITGKFEEE